MLVESELMKKIMKSFVSGLILVGMMNAITAYAQNDSLPQSSVPSASLEKMKEKIAKHQAELHDKLKITAAQEPAWKTFIQVVTPERMVPEKDSGMDKMTTPERMQRSLERMKEHQGQLQKKLEATKAFYAVLSPEQQKIFDNSHRHMKKEMQERMAKQMRSKEGLMTDKP
jgi:protein CpxP